MKPKPRYRPQPLIAPAPTLASAAGYLAHLAQLWRDFTIGDRDAAD